MGCNASHSSMITDACTVGADRVWSLADLELLHEIAKPTVVVSSAVQSSPTSPGGLKDVSEILFVSKEAVRRWGPPRPPGGYDMILGELTETQRQTRRTWLNSIVQSKASKESFLDLGPLVYAVFQNASPNTASRMTHFLSKAIQVEVSPGCVKTAILHIVDPEAASPADTRVGAMHERDPIHTMMFDSKGFLLTANKAALHSFRIDTSGMVRPDTSSITLKRLFDAGAYSGGQTEADAAYAEAVHAVFALKVDCHRHAQPHVSKKDGRMKWAMLEMWPMQDPISDSAAVLIKSSNITQQKSLEQELEQRQDFLQRHNAELEQDSVAMQAQTRRLQREANSLARRLEAVMHDKHKPNTSFDAATPIDKTLEYLQNVIMGREVQSQQAVDLYNILSESDTNLRQPVGMENQLLKDSAMDSDVAQSMIQLLQGNRTADKKHSHQGEATAGSLKELWTFNTDPMQDEAVTDAQSLQSGVASEAMDEQMAVIQASITPAVERMLQDAQSNWQFDVFAFAEAAPGHSLSMLSFHLLKHTGLIQEFGLDEIKLRRFLMTIEAGYNPTIPYHNSTHVASVVQMTHMLLSHGGVLACNVMTRGQQLATYWSAIVHDFQHGGLNNDFLIKSLHPLALLYNDQSPLENHHLSSSMRLMHQPEHMFMRDVIPSSVVGEMRHVSIHQVLGTDMKKHFDITSRFQAAYKKPAAGSGGSVMRRSGDALSAMDWDTVKAEDKILVYQMVLKCADIGHLAAAPAMHQRWASQLEEEFFRQGDQERRCGLPVSPLMDRSQKGGMTKSQVGFFNIVGIPLIKAMTDLFEDAKPMMDGVLANYHSWEAAAAVAETRP